jgi:hypothetical protein
MLRLCVEAQFCRASTLAYCQKANGPLPGVAGRIPRYTRRTQILVRLEASGVRYLLIDQLMATNSCGSITFPRMRPPYRLLQVETPLTQRLHWTARPARNLACLAHLLL